MHLIAKERDSRQIYLSAEKSPTTGPLLSEKQMIPILTQSTKALKH